ncbi:hypothetical protein GCM10008934_18230 [Virgibacillus salarius]
MYNGKTKMSNKLFTEKEIKIRSRYPYVKSVSEELLIQMNLSAFSLQKTNKKSFREIFVEYGFDISILGIDRIKSADNRWSYLFDGSGKKAYLSTIKDGSTNELLVYNVSSSLALEWQQI